MLNVGGFNLDCVALLLGHPHQLLADVLSVEKSNEGLRGIFQAVHDALPVLDPAFLDPLAHLLLSLTEPIGKLENKEPLDTGLLDDEVREQPWAARRPGGVVLVDLAADNDSSAYIDLGEDGVRQRTADVLVFRYRRPWQAWQPAQRRVSCLFVPLRKLFGGGLNRKSRVASSRGKHAER
jgi:hypothetical protein